MGWFDIFSYPTPFPRHVKLGPRIWYCSAQPKARNILLNRLVWSHHNKHSGCGGINKRKQEKKRNPNKSKSGLYNIYGFLI